MCLHVSAVRKCSMMAPVCLCSFPEDAVRKCTMQYRYLYVLELAIEAAHNYP